MTKTIEVNSELQNGSGLRAWIVLLMGALFLLPVCSQATFAQEGTEGIDKGAYHYEGSFDLGYRFVNTLGAKPVYDTFVDERQGPRLLDQTLNVRSLEHQGLLFDNLFVSSFGWGGDPENSVLLHRALRFDVNPAMSLIVHDARPAGDHRDGARYLSGVDVALNGFVNDCTRSPSFRSRLAKGR